MPRLERGYHFDSGSKELIGGKVTPDDGEDGAMIALEKVEREEERFFVPEVVDDHGELELKEILSKITNNNIEQRILELRGNGYTIEEIGDMISVSRGVVGKLLLEMRERYHQYMKNA